MGERNKKQPIIEKDTNFLTKPFISCPPVELMTVRVVFANLYKIFKSAKKHGKLRILTNFTIKPIRNVYEISSPFLSTSFNPLCSTDLGYEEI